MRHLDDPPRLGFFRAILILAFGLLLAAAHVAVAEDVVVDFGDEATDGIPRPWRLLGNPRAYAPDFRVEEDTEQGHVLRLHAKGRQSDGIYRSVRVDLGRTPYVNFTWKADIHPGGRMGSDKDDEAVRIQLDFGRHGFRRRVLSYGFDPAAEPGRWYNNNIPFATIRVLVLDSGDEKLGEWISHSRNVVEDYRRAFGGNPPRVQTVSVYCDSKGSNGEALGYCSKITFSGEPLVEAEEAD